MERYIVSRSDVTLEAVYQGFSMSALRDDAPFVEHLVGSLSQYGLKLSDMKLERGNGNLGELHWAIFLLDYLLTIRVRADRTELYCSTLTAENKPRVVDAAMAVLQCVRQHVASGYRAYAVSMNIHGLVDPAGAKSFLSRLITAPAANLGPVLGNAVAYYFAPIESRIASSVMFDVSALVPDGLFARPQATWDAGKLPLEQLPSTAESFVQHTLSTCGLDTSDSE